MSTMARLNEPLVSTDNIEICTYAVYSCLWPFMAFYGPLWLYIALVLFLLIRTIASDHDIHSA
jgi:hypothetical protein